MIRLTSEGRAQLAQLAERFGFSADAVESMFSALVAGGGGMAQFDHPGFGGSGQWMRGGMLMIGDPSDHALKSRIDRLCNALADTLASNAEWGDARGFQRQSQTGGGVTAVQDSRDFASCAPMGKGGSSGARGTNGTSLFEPTRQAPWWPASLGAPDSSGAQNDVRYAYFAQQRRLAIDHGGAVTVYDTRDHRIGGFSQQQGGRGSLSFSSQHGVVDVDRLPVAEHAEDRVDPRTAAHAEAASTSSQGHVRPDHEATDPFAAIEKLAQLHARGILSEEEFREKKAELLNRI